MDDLARRNFLLTAKQRYHKRQYAELIIPEEEPYPPVQYEIYQVLVSQFGTIMSDDSSISPDNLQPTSSSLPLSMVYATYTRHIDSKRITQALKILHRHLQKHYQLNNHIISLNIAKLYFLLGDHRKSLFYLELSLKEKPNFDIAVYEYCRILAHSQRRKEATAILHRHLVGKSTLADSTLIQSLYLSLAIEDINSNCSQQIIREVTRIFHKKQLKLKVVFNLGLFMMKVGKDSKAIELFKKLDQELFEYYQVKAPFPLKKLIIMARINLAKLYQRQDNVQTDSLLAVYQKLQKDFPSDKQIQFKINTCQTINKTSHQADQNFKLLSVESLIRPNDQQDLISSNSSQQDKQNLTEKQFRQQRKRNKQKLQFLINKQKQINYFFRNFGITQQKLFRAKQSFALKMINQSVSDQLVYQEFDQEFEEKKKLHKLKYDKQELQSVIDNYLSQVFGCSLKPKTQKQKKQHTLVKNQSTKSNYSLSRTAPKKLRTSTSNRQFRIKRQEKNLAQKRESIKNQLKITQNKEFIEKTNIQTEIAFPNLLVMGPAKQSVCIQKENETKKQVKIQVKKQQEKLQEGSGSNLMEQKQSAVSLFRRKSLKKETPVKAPVRSQLNSTAYAIKEFDQSLNKRNINNKFNLTSTERKNTFKGLLGTTEVSRFAKQLSVGQKLQSQKKLEEAYEHYAKMYKEFKKEKEKEQIMLKIGTVLQIQEKFAEAEKAYQKCSKQDSAEAFMRLGSLQISLGKVGEGVQSLEKANCIERSNTTIETKLVYGYSLREQTIDKAFALAGTILKRNPECLQALIMSANILQKKGKVKEALEIAHAIDHNKQSVQVKHYIGLLYLQASNIALAFQHFQEALKLKPNHVPSLIEIGTILSAASPKESARIISKALQLEPQNKLALARLGKIYQAEQDFGNAIQIYKNILAVQPNHDTYIKIGDCLRKQECLTEAYLNYRQALMIKKSSQVYEKIAEIYERQGQCKKAYDTYQTALSYITLDHTKTQQKKLCYIQSGKMALVLQDYENAIHCLRDALDIQETGSELSLLGDAYYGKGEFDQALQHFQKALKMTGNERDQQDWQLLQKIALCFDRRQEYLASKAIYEKIIQQCPDNIKAMNNLACILLLIGDTNEAFYWFENMLLKVPNSIQKRLKVADNYVQVGDWSKVQHHLMICYKLRENDMKVIQKLLNLYKEKRDVKQISKFEKKLNILKAAQLKK